MHLEWNHTAGNVALDTVTGTTIPMLYPLSQVTSTHLKSRHPHISFMSARSSDELQRLDYMMVLLKSLQLMMMEYQDSDPSNSCQEPLLLTWINFNPSMGK